MKLFTGAQFSPTKWDTAEQKAKFANQFVRFVESDFKESLFPKWFYNRLSMTFGHIAHYDQAGFYGAQFSTLRKQLAFLDQTVNGGGYGDPAYTYSDVERALAAWVIKSGIAAKIEAKLGQAIEAAERNQLARLQVKYGAAA